VGSTVSVVVAARNAARTIGPCVASARAQGAVVGEVIVVDDGSDDETSALATVAGAAVTRLETSGGPSRARNAGAARATGDVLAFLDADAVARPGWAAALLDALAGGAAVVAGQIEPPAAPGRSAVVRFAAERRPAPDTSGKNGFLPCGMTANLAVRADVFRDLGGLDERLAAREDADFCFRAQLAGHPFAITDRAVVEHAPRDTLVGLLRQQARDARAAPLMRWKYQWFPFQGAVQRADRRGPLTVLAHSSATAALGRPPGGDALVTPLLDAAVTAARRVGEAAGRLDVLTGWRPAPAVIDPASATAAARATPLPGDPVAIITGATGLRLRALATVAAARAGMIAAPNGLEYQALDRWDDPAPWSLWLARRAAASGWDLPADLAARRLERERPRSWGAAFVDLHRVHAWLHASTRYAIVSADRRAADALAARLPEVRVVDLGGVELTELLRRPADVADRMASELGAA
jgi:hypothetical protein